METKRKLRATIVMANHAIGELSRRIEKLENPYPPTKNEASIDIPVVDSVGATVLDTLTRGIFHSDMRFAKVRSISLTRFVKELEKDLGITVCWEQNTDKLVIYTTGET